MTKQVQTEVKEIKVTAQILLMYTTSLWRASAFCSEDLQMTTNILSSALTVSPFDEPDKRYIGGMVVNVTYHQTDWIKCFRPNISAEILKDAILGYMVENIDVSYERAKSIVLKMSDGLIQAYANVF